jgi:hypothetical protein
MLIPHAQFKRLRGVGHLPMVERPRVTARLLRRFWRESRAAGHDSTAGQEFHGTTTTVAGEAL